MSESSSLDFLPQRQLIDWKTLAWNAANDIDLEKRRFWFGGQLAESLYRLGTPLI